MQHHQAGSSSTSGINETAAAAFQQQNRPTLSAFVHEERLHITEAYSRLFFLTFYHFTTEVLRNYCLPSTSQHQRN
ncbi:unnamed protein product, partial [Amoebophrya sp. A120]|eukprot:GSA120T00017037001.1